MVFQKKKFIKNLSINIKSSTFASKKLINENRRY